MLNLIKIIFLIGIFITPFIFWPWAKIAYEIPRVIFFERLIEILFIIGLFAIKSEFPKRKPYYFLIALIGCFMTVVVIASLLGNDFLKSLWGNYYRRDGIFTFYHHLMLFFILAFFWQRSWENVLAATIALSSFFISLWTVYWGLLLHLFKISTIVNWEGAIGVSFRQPNFLAGYLLVTLPFLFYKTRTSRINGAGFFWILGILLQFSALVFTKSIVGILIASVFILIKLQSAFSIHFKKRRLLYFMEAGILLVIGILFLYNYFEKYNISKNFIAESRVRIYTKGYLAFLKKPLLGYGWANFDYAFESIDWPIKLTPDVYVDKAHSHFLEILTTTGILGLGFYIALIIKIIINISKRKEIFYTSLLSSFLLFVIYSQTNVVSVASEIFFWMIAGIAASNRN